MDGVARDLERRDVSPVDDDADGRAALAAGDTRRPARLAGVPPAPLDFDLELPGARPLGRAVGREGDRRGVVVRPVGVDGEPLLARRALEAEAPRLAAELVAR